MTLARRRLILVTMMIGAIAVFAIVAASARRSAGAVVFLPGGRIAGAATDEGDLLLFINARRETVYRGDVGPVWTFLDRDVPWGVLGDLWYVAPLPTYNRTDPTIRDLRFGQFRAARRDTAVAIRAPAWAVLALCTGTLIAGPAGRALRSRRRRRRGLCTSCGYDLRVSTGVCPECGTPVTRPPSHSVSRPPRQVEQSIG